MGVSADGGFGRFFIIYSDKSKVDFRIPGAVLTIGSDARNGLRLAHPHVAGFHCRFEWREGRPTVVDIPGSGGLFVNQVRVPEQALRQGDVVKVGDCFMVYHEPSVTAYAAAVPGVQVGPSAVVPAHAPAPAPKVAGSPSTILPELVSGRIQEQPLSGGRLRIGRDPANTIVLNHLQVSRFHAEIVQRGDGWWLSDAKSTNGTFVNGVRATAPVRLARGDRIKISDYNFYFDGERLEHFSEEGNARIDAISLRRVVGGRQVILQDVSLSIYPREFVAVVGGSGAGKSTLVSALSGFRPADYGVVLLNGLDYYEHLEAFRSTLGYVPQDDIIHPELTTERALQYAARLRMPEDTLPEERAQRIDEVLRDLQLEERRGVPIHRLSGGQRKRVSIGVELLTRPRLFYLDEPTSGLDPGMEAEMMRIFRKLADAGHTLILITHATRNIMLCDQVVFLARGGYLAWYGPPAEALQYFHADDFADIYLKVEHEKSPAQWDEAFKQSAAYDRYVSGRLQEVNELAAQARTGAEVALATADRSSVENRASQLRQFFILARRYLDILSRDRVNLSILLAQAPVLACVLLILCQPDVFHHFSMKHVEEAGKLASKAKIIIFLLSFFSLMCGTINSVREIVKEYPIFKRERTVNLRIVPYVMSKAVVLAGVSAFQTAVFIAIVFARVDPPPGVKDFYGLCFLAMFATNLAGTAMGLAVSAAVNNQNTAITTLPITLLTQVVLSGALLPLEGLKMLSSLTIMKWGFEMLGKITRVWKTLPARSDFPGGMVPLDARPLLQTGLDYKDQFDVAFWPYLAALGFFVLFFLAMACILQRARGWARE